MNKEAIEQFIQAVKEPEFDSSKTNLAIVSKVDAEGVVWVNLAGSEKETPTASTSAEVKSGDVVNVEWRNNKLYIAGNYTNPSAGIIEVRHVVQIAGETKNIADAAKKLTEQVKKIADNTNQYFWHTQEGTDTGAHITEIPQEDFIADPDNGGGNLLARSNGIAIRDGLTELAQFGASGVQIGQSDGANTVIDANGQRTYAGNGNVLISNIGYGNAGDSSGAIAQAPYYTMGWRNEPNAQPYDSSATYKAGDACIYDGKIYILRQDITTPEEWVSTKWYYYRGAHSMAEGYSNIASGSNSHAEGLNTKAIVGNCHTEGTGTIARSSADHAEGGYTIAGGGYSHAQNENTVTVGRATTAIGTYNTIDTYPSSAVHPNGSRAYFKNAFIIGNGTADNARSNAMTVDWNGNIEIAGTVKNLIVTEQKSTTLSLPASDTATASINMAFATIAASLLNAAR